MNKFYKILHSEKWLKFSIVQKYIIYKIDSKSKKCKNIDDFVNLTYDGLVTKPFLNANIQPSQVKSEITELTRIVQKLEPFDVLEIGTARGGTLFLWTVCSAPFASIISVDLPHGQFGGGYSKSKIKYYKSFASKLQMINLIQADSHLQSTFENVEKILEKSKLDFLFIDGDHTFEGVKKDFEMYSPLVKKGGIIALHDICPHSESEDEVFKFWNEIKGKYQSKEIIEDKNQGWAGIGVIYV